MTPRWHLFLLALRDFSRIPVPASFAGGATRPLAAARYLPLVGALIGAIGGAVFWLAAQIWPASIAVVLSMLAALIATGAMHETAFAEACALLGKDRNRETSSAAAGESRFGAAGAIGLVFVLLIKYNALIALSAASLPFALPPNVALILILIAAHAASRALLVSAIAAQASAPPVTGGELAFALVCGFAPATLLGTPGLIGLAGAIVMRIALAAYARRWRGATPRAALGAVQQLTELSFYLATLSAWTFI